MNNWQQEQCNCSGQQDWFNSNSATAVDNNRIGSPADSRVDNRDWSNKTGRVGNRIGPPAKVGMVRNRICPPAKMDSTTGLDHQQRRSGQQQRSPTRRGRRIAMKTNSGINRFRNW